MRSRLQVLSLVVLAATALFLAGRMWEWVLNLDPAIHASAPRVESGRALTSGVTILLIDGLRLDASRAMPALNELRARGADIEAHVGTPSFSRPGRATIITGAPPAIHGVTSNRQRRALSVDHLIRLVADASGRCRVAGSSIWPGLARADIDRCGVAFEGEGKEGPGMFERQVPAIRAWQQRAVDFVLEERAMLRIVDIVSTDFAAHEYGGSSEPYKAEVSRADAAIGALAKRLDLTRETFLVVADHGHRDAGGHGGDEEVVLDIPAVFVGAGVKPGIRVTGNQADMAPTIAALLGLPLPSSSAGRPLAEILDGDAAKIEAVRASGERQRQAFEAAVRARFGVPAGESGDWAGVIETARAAERRQRTPLMAGIVAALVIACVLLLRGSGVGVNVRAALTDAMAVFAVVCAASLFNPVLSFSAINYDQLVLAYFGRIMAVASCGVVVAIVVSATLRARRQPTPGVSAAAGAASTGLLVCLGLALTFVLWWWRFGFLIPGTIPGPGRLVEGYALLLSLMAAATTSLAVVAATALSDRRRER